MIRKGKMKTMSQYTLRGWAKGGLGLEGGHDGVQEGRIQRRGRTREIRKGIGKNKEAKQKRIWNRRKTTLGTKR